MEVGAWDFKGKNGSLQEEGKTKASLVSEHLGQAEKWTHVILPQALFPDHTRNAIPCR